MSYKKLGVSPKEFKAHADDKENPHGVTKSQVGLGSVQNYGIATQTEAKEGKVNDKYMTPLRTSQYVQKISGETAGSVQANLDAHIGEQNNPHKVTKSQVGLSNVDNVKQASKSALDSHAGDAIKHITASERAAWDAKETPSGAQVKATKALEDAKIYTDAHLKGTVTSVNGKKPSTSGNVDLGELVHSVAGIAPDDNGNVPLAIGDLSTDSFISPAIPPKDYPLGVTTFRGNQSQSREWQDLVGDGIVNTRVLVVTYKASNVWQATQAIYLIDGYANTGNTIQHRAMYVRSAMASTQSSANQWSDPVKVMSNKDLSDSTTSNSSDTVATSKAVYKLQQEISDLRNAIIQLKDKG